MIRALLRWSLMLACAIFCAGFFAYYLYMVLANTFPGPTVDYWADMDKIAALFSPTASVSLQEWLSLHNGAHRLLIPRLLFALDYYFFDGTNLLLVAVSFLCRGILLYLLNIGVRHLSLASRLLVNTIFFAGLFHIAQLNIIVITSNIQWDLAFAFSFLSVYFFSQTGKHSQALCLLCMLLAIFSNALALALPPFFVICSLFFLKGRPWQRHLLLFFIIYIIYFYLLPLWIGESSSSGYRELFQKDVTSIALTLLVLLPNFVIRLIGALTASLGYLSLYFSFFFIGAMGWLLWKCKSAAQYDASRHLLLLFGLFCFLAIGTIAGGRAATSPFFYGAGQYAPLGILFMLCIGGALYVNLPHHFSGTVANALRGALLLHVLFVLMWDQVQLTVAGFPKSNKALQSHALMLFTEANQFSGKGVRRWVQERDVIAELDPFLKQHGFAWYHNKLPAANATPPLDVQECTSLPGSPQYMPTDSGYELSQPLQLRGLAYFRTAFQRSTYHVLDAQGQTLGYSYFYMPPESHWPMPELKGYLHKPEARYLAEWRGDRLHCLYRLDSP